MDEGHIWVLHGCGCSYFYHYVFSDLYCSRWIWSVFRDSYILAWEFVHGFHGVRCNVIVCVYIFVVDVLRNPDITVQRGRFPQVLAYENDCRPFLSFLFDSNYDDNLRHYAFYDASRSFSVDFLSDYIAG